MVGRSTILETVAAALCLLLALAPRPAAAQFESGALYGSVTTSAGETLPAVALTLSGVGSELEAASDDHGRFRFLGLAPGIYTIRAELDTYAPLVYESLSILVGRPTTLQLQMSVIPSEIVVVSTEPPLLDVDNGARGIRVDWVELGSIPTTRDPWSVADRAPGVLVAGANVGGNETGLQPAFVGPGARQEENAFAIDGVVITDMAAAGFSPTYYDYEQFDQVEVTVGGPDASLANPGVTINMLTKSASDQARGAARVLWTGEGMQAEPHTDRGDYPPTQEETAAQRFTGLSEVGLEGGGPLFRDGLWGWGSYGLTDVRRQSVIDTLDRTRLETAGAKLDVSPGARSWLVASAASNDKIRDGMGAGPDRAPETFWRQSGPFRMLRVEGTRNVSPNFQLAALFSDVNLDFAISPAGPAASDPIWDPEGVWRGGFLELAAARDSTLWKVDGSRLFDGDESSHELNLGLSRRRFDSLHLEDWGPRQLIHIAGENLGSKLDRLEALRQGRSQAIQEYSALWLQDSWKVGRRTVDLGLRYDLQHGRTPALTVEANPVFPDLLPRVRVPDHEPEFAWSTVSPRLGVSYLLGEQGRNVVRASYSRFSSQLHAEVVGRESPQYGANAQFEFEDSNGNGIFDGDETAHLLSTKGVDPENPTAIESPNVTDPALAPEITDEILLGLQHEIRSDLVVGLDVSLRRVRGILETRTLVRGADGVTRPARAEDYVSDQVVSGTAPDGGVFAVPVYSLSPDLEYTGGRLLTNGDREQSYKGVTLNVDKRLGNRWMLRGQATVSDWRWKIGPEFRRFDDPTDIVSSAGVEKSAATADSDGDVVAQQVQPFGENEGFFLNSRWSFDVSGAYEVAPERPWGFTIAAQLSGREGFPVPYFVSVTPRDGLAREVQVTPRSDTVRHDDLYLLDARIQKELGSERLTTTLGLDAFNLFNRATVLQRSRQLNGPQALFVQDTLSPRVLRLSLRFSWR